MSASGTNSAWSERRLGGKYLKFIEVSVAIVILVILAVVATLGLHDRAETNTCKAEVNAVKSAYTAYVAQNGAATPANLATLQAVPGSMLKKPMQYVDDVSSAGAISMKRDAPCHANT